MNTITTLDDNSMINVMNSGEHLASIREQKGYALEYVASKLHLRVRVIELLESNQYSLLPGPVFIKGYLRAYAKLLEVSPEPYLALFNDQYVVEKKPTERALWQQSKRETHKGEHVIRWFTILFAVGVMVAVGVWWQKNADNQQQEFADKNNSAEVSINDDTTTTELKLTDISKMQSLLDPKPTMSPLEKTGG